jgi:hypothetical protein
LGFSGDLFGGVPVPGLGFDFPHLAAINQGAGVRALIDPITQHQLALALRIRALAPQFSPGFFSPFGGSPVILESPSMAIPRAEAPVTEQVSVEQQPAHSEQVSQSPFARQDDSVRDAGEFVLIQRDGRLLFAVGFTAEPGRVVYVTKEGLRRSIPLDQLDVDATQRMNEERGTSVQIPKV